MGGVRGGGEGKREGGMRGRGRGGERRGWGRKVWEEG